MLTQTNETLWTAVEHQEKHYLRYCLNSHDLEASALVSTQDHSSLFNPAIRSQAATSFITLHGMEENWDVFESTLERLRPTPALRLDMPWSGQKGYDWGLNDTPLAQRLLCALKQLPHQPRIVIAHSFGTSALLSYIDKYGTSAFDALILISPFYLFNEQEFDWEALQYYGGFYQQFLESTVTVRMKKTLDPDIQSRMAEHIKNKIGPFGCILSLYQLIRSRSFDLTRIQIPTLVITGEDDFYSLPDHCQRIADTLPQGECSIIKDSGHFSMIDDPQTVANHIQKFITKSTGISL